MLRSTWWLALAALAGASAASSANAQDCESDDACPTGTFCSRGGGNDAVEDQPCREGETCDTPVPPMPGSCEPLPTGYCEAQSDCVEGLECIKGSSSAPCASDQPAPAPADDEVLPGDDKPVDFVPPECEQTEPEESRYGVCTLPVTACQNDDQCLAGLSCVASRDGGTTTSEGGGADTPVPAPTEKDGDAAGFCVFEPKDCSDGAACADGYECVEVVTGEWCTGSGGSAPCADDDTDCVPVEPTEPECGTDTASYCFPKKDPCTSDADCAADWTCVEFSNAEGGLETPEYWDESGAIKSCLPDGVALIAQSPAGANGIATRDGAASAPGVGGGDVLDEGSSENDDGSSPPKDASAKSGDGSSSMCAVRAGRESSAAAALVLGMLGAVFVRRRRR